MLLFLLTGIEGVCNESWHSLGANLKAPAKLLQLMQSRNESVLDGIADSVIDKIYQSFEQQSAYYMVGHSFGALIALKIASMLEKRGKIGHIILIDGSPGYLSRLGQGLCRNIDHIRTAEILENDLIMVLFTHFCSSDQLDRFSKKLTNCDENDDLSTKIGLMSEFVTGEFKTAYSEKYLKNIMTAIVNRLKVVMNLNSQTDQLMGVMDRKLKSAITLIRPTQATFTEIAEDYDLHNYSEQKVNIKFVAGNHLTVLDNVELTDILNNITSR